MLLIVSFYFFFFFNDTATTEIYTLSLHDALPISAVIWGEFYVKSKFDSLMVGIQASVGDDPDCLNRDRKSTRLNSSHDQISYAVFCLKKKKNKTLPIARLTLTNLLNEIPAIE